MVTGSDTRSMVEPVIVPLEMVPFHGPSKGRRYWTAVVAEASEQLVPLLPELIWAVPDAL